MTTNWEMAGTLSEIIGAIAVIVSLLYVAAQIKQSNRQGASDSSYAWVAESNRFLAWISEPEIASVLIKMRGDGEITPAEEIRFDAFAEHLLNAWWAGETSYQNGIMDKDTYLIIAGEVRRYLDAYPRLRRDMRRLLSHHPIAAEMGIFASILQND
jgi:hypothetical protein